MLGKKRCVWKKIGECDAAMYGIIALLSAGVFCMIYGVRVLHPAYTDWLLSGGDLSQHYIGWKAYRSAKWMFPIGMTDRLVYPDCVSVIFTDSIPIFAVFFKLLSPVLPAEFQYFGVWGILCFVLQGCLSARIVRHFTKDRLFIVAAGVLFTLAPVMIWRMYAHTALAGQWILLFVMEPLFAYRKYEDNKKIFGTACAAGILAPAVHIYFVLMCGMVLAAFCLRDLLAQKRVKKSVEVLFLYVLSGCVTVWLLGGFSSSVQAASGGLGAYGFNMNALFNPQGWSCILQDLPLYGGGQYEGFAYLGAGCIGLLVLAAAFFLNAKQPRAVLQREWKALVSIVFLLAVAAWTAFSPVVTLGDHVIHEFALPELYIKIMSIFRASGRISWIIVYVLMLCSVIVLAKCVEKRMLAAVLAAGIVLQAYDMHLILEAKKQQFQTETVYDSPLKTDAFWEEAAKETGHIVFAGEVSNEEMYAFGDWAFRNQKTLNTFYLARGAQEQVQKRLEEALEKLPEDHLFIFHDKDLLRCLDYDLHYYQIDGFIIGSRRHFEGFSPMEKEAFENVWTFGGNQYLENGQDTDDGRIINAGGLSYGPYWSVPAGNYRIEIAGEQILNNVQVIVYSQRGGCGHEVQWMEGTEDVLNLSLQLNEDVQDLEICLRNDMQDAVKVKGIRLIRE